MPRPTVRSTRTGSRRLAKTIVLAALALAASLIWLGGESEVAASNLSEYALVSLLWLAIPVLVAAVGFGLFAALKRLFQGRRAREQD